MNARHRLRALGSAAAIVCVVGAVAATASADEAPAPTREAARATFDAETLVLANGLTVLLAPDPSARLVSVRVTYHAGARDDPPGLRGLAHLTEHMVASRTKHAHAGIRMLASFGASAFNATTTIDCTHYFETVPPERLETALWIEADRMGFASSEVTDDRVTAERAILDNEERMRKRDSPVVSALALQMHEVFPADHRYAPISDEAAFEGRFSARDVWAFLATWYWPTNATLSIAGKFDRVHVRELLTRYFESLPSLPRAVRPPLRDARPERVELEVSANIPAGGTWLSWRTPAFAAPGDAALDIAASILTSDRLQTELVDAHLATSVLAHQSSYLEGSVFRVAAVSAVGASPAQLARAVEATVARLAKQVTPEELTRARRRLRLSELDALSSTEGRAAALASLGQLGPVNGPLLDQVVSRYEVVTAEDVQQAILAWLAPAQQVTILIVPSRGSPVAGRLTRRVAGLP